MGGCQNFGWKKSKKWKKSGGGCNFGLIWENIQYLYRIFSCSPPLPSVPGHKITNFQRWHNIDTTVGKDTFAVPRSYPNLYESIKKVLAPKCQKQWRQFSPNPLYNFLTKECICFGLKLGREIAEFLILYSIVWRLFD